MRLEKIKLVGFKSFVDQTVIELRSNLAGIVGPNGCGKSNVIDAVRWVMGESSVKTLRGESMDDVIFSGSTGRKPVGQASVELLFDNSDGSLGGEYAAYSQIAIRREVTRDGESHYFLNSTRCRRRDIKDIFMGTGLGPRSYAIIQQGTISRVIEAKPEEMRNFVEEAAGISRYKERRRETETRMRHTRENLERVNDIREELDKQLERLKRQSRAAERYKELKIEQRQLQAQLYALKLQAIEAKLQTQKALQQRQEVVLEGAIATLRKCDAEIETSREKHTELTDEFNAVQKDYYNVGAEIVKLEQSLQHGRHRCEELSQDLTQTFSALAEAKEHYKTDEEKIQSLEVKTQTLTPQISEAKQTADQALTDLQKAENAMQTWQNTWDDFNMQAAKASEQAQVEQARIQQLEQRIEEAFKRLEAIKTEEAQLDDSLLQAEILELQADIGRYEQTIEAHQVQLNENHQRIHSQRALNQQIRDDLSNGRSELQKAQGRLASLEALQQAALGQQAKGVVQWLEQHGLANFPRLAQQLTVETGWERAVEAVLGTSLEAICLPGIDSLETLFADITHLPTGQVTLLNIHAKAHSGQHDTFLRLADKIAAPFSIEALIEGIYIAETLEEAIAAREQLSSTESIVTREGIWLSPSWVRILKEDNLRSGVIIREQELQSLQTVMSQQEAAVSDCIQKLADGEHELQMAESNREGIQRQLDQHRDECNRTRSQLTVKQGRCEQLAQRRLRLNEETQSLMNATAENRRTLEKSRQIWQEALTLMEAQADTRDELQLQRQQVREKVERIRPQAHSAKDVLHRLSLEIGSAQTELSSLKIAKERLQKQVNDLEARQMELEQALQAAKMPLATLETQLQATLMQRSNIEEILQQARVRLQEAEERVRDYEHQRSEIASQIETIRHELEQMRLDSQADSVRHTAIAEQLAEMGQILSEVLAAVAEGSTIDSIDAALADTGEKIQRLGAINLAAIEEYDVELERKQHLDSQYADLSEALETLEAAIRKIDRETRQRFKDTFDNINGHFQTLFPTLFGGGEAYLELTGDDLLETGIAVMARPPGKRNTSIHLLSGGEKALTAISLVFAIFKLNPAPFCMLDEVDAPLDEANVVRFCNLVQKIAETVQVIFISHNKVAIEMSKQLMGVTMHEPGVSRLVAVDMEEAVAMAEDLTETIA
ncbi:MAG: chromosome segregation protein [Gammaproteobacteria bacterium]|jgi:chromosome segregation protein|nr:chromosome segregation protein [Gammaproteobacteria bacterium]